MGRDRDRERGVDPRQLLDRHRVGESIRTAAPILRRERDPHQAQLAELRDELVREALLAVQLGGDGCHLLAREVAHRIPQQTLLVTQLEVQGGRSLRADDLWAA
jgi:hypothetical protein